MERHVARARVLNLQTVLRRLADFMSLLSNSGSGSMDENLPAGFCFSASYMNNRIEYFSPDRFFI